MKIAAVIPARLESSRFPRKVLHNFCGTPMIEHVRLRAEKSNVFQAGVYVATCDTEIYELVKSNGGNPIMTSKSHSNGTSRVAEAIKDIDCSHVLVLQADEPLITPKIMEEFVGLRSKMYSIKLEKQSAEEYNKNEKDKHKHKKIESKNRKV